MDLAMLGRSPPLGGGRNLHLGITASRAVGSELHAEPGHLPLHLAEGSLSNVTVAPILCRRRQYLEQQWARAPLSFSDPSSRPRHPAWRNPPAPSRSAASAGTPFSTIP